MTPIPHIERDKLGRVLRAFWDEQMSFKNLAVAGSNPSVFSLGPALDSLTACGVLVEVETQLKLATLPEHLIKHGGYEDVEDFVNHFSARLEKHLSK